jgi:hypothetical protein
MLQQFLILHAPEGALDQNSRLGCSSELLAHFVASENALNAQGSLAALDRFQVLQLTTGRVLPESALQHYGAALFFSANCFLVTYIL